ncbi:hypothetical protein M9H77_04332 [Catharanthus roseus]|uniref:Uncharacterized protein n=1 Tax=Catharanthus roseus TaxID=4058 RepID=A0ACC0CDT2_CATRO|nr:hypothetical protein M9H77_04332 [Catharanthus roseus]
MATTSSLTSSSPLLSKSDGEEPQVQLSRNPIQVPTRLSQMDPRIWHKVAAISGVAAVGLGAYGAHMFKPQNPTYKQVWQTASLYHLAHTAALLAAPVTNHPNIFGGLMTAGVLAFSGSSSYGKDKFTKSSIEVNGELELFSVDRTVISLLPILAKPPIRAIVNHWLLRRILKIPISTAVAIGAWLDAMLLLTLKTGNILPWLLLAALVLWLGGHACCSREVAGRCKLVDPADTSEVFSHQVLICTLLNQACILANKCWNAVITVGFGYSLPLL